MCSCVAACSRAFVRLRMCAGAKVPNYTRLRDYSEIDQDTGRDAAPRIVLAGLR